MPYYDSSRHDPILANLNSALNEVERNHMENKMLREQRGDDPVLREAFITATVHTEQRAYTGRVFDVHSDDTLLYLYDTSVKNPRSEDANPAHAIRASSIVSASVHERPAFLPIEFPMQPEEFHAAATSFIQQAATILRDSDEDPDLSDEEALHRLLDATEPIAVTREQQVALRAAAQPVNDTMLDSTIVSKWNRVASAIAAINGLPPAQHPAAHDDDPYLNIEVINTDDAFPRTTTLLKFLTHGVPVNYLYPDTHQQAIDAYTTQVRVATNAGF